MHVSCAAEAVRDSLELRSADREQAGVPLEGLWGVTKSILAVDADVVRLWAVVPVEVV